MIKWYLDRVMAVKGKSGKVLADELGVHPNTVYKLRNTSEMPMISGKRLSKLCEILKCQLSDLIEYVPSSTSNGH